MGLAHPAQNLALSIFSRGALASAAAKCAGLAANYTKHLPSRRCFGFPTVRWLSEEMLSVSHFSNEKRLCAVSHEHLVLFVSHVQRTLTTPLAHLGMLPWLRNNPHHCEVLRSLALSTWLSHSHPASRHTTRVPDVTSSSYTSSWTYMLREVETVSFVLAHHHHQDTMRPVCRFAKLCGIQPL